jgi:hypothetical protein
MVSSSVYQNPAIQKLLNRQTRVSYLHVEVHSDAPEKGQPWREGVDVKSGLEACPVVKIVLYCILVNCE